MYLLPSALAPHKPCKITSESSAFEEVTIQFFERLNRCTLKEGAFGGLNHMISGRTGE
ncbi:hypothetical protein B0H34DRAFT_800672 [Crassisporium funariophilum]|nr:hypothetical protein B0H34DRAFT_800669 [Crassisporium funariophilum]KAF8152180.1 hypothetical protein B0H34DRAFT_800672 [Crassisporium funariophilum]